MPDYGYSTPTFMHGAGEIKAAAKEFVMKETVLSGVGVVVGGIVGEWFAEYVSSYFNVTETWQKFITESIIKGITGTVLIYGGYKAGGVLRLILSGAAVGCWASIILDLIAASGWMTAQKPATIKTPLKTKTVAAPSSGKVLSTAKLTR